MSLINMQICDELYKRGKWNVTYCQLCPNRNRKCKNLEYYNEQEATAKQCADFQEDMRYVNQGVEE